MSSLENRMFRRSAVSYAKDPKELLLLATGEPFDPHYYVDYLTEKYSRLYGIEN